MNIPYGYERVGKCIHASGFVGSFMILYLS
jgi:hypothetical protein